MERIALLGWPVRHSLSPPMQLAGFRALGLEATYELIEVQPRDLAATVDRLQRDAFRGWNVTVPHKEAMAELVHDLDPDAAAAGSVNTVLNHNGTLKGFSTDGYGLQTAIRESFGLDLSGTHVLFVGAGGAARAVAIHAARHGAAAVSILNRTPERADALVELVHQAAPTCRTRTAALADTRTISALLEDVAVVVQCTSLGLHDGEPPPLAPELLPPGVPVMDMIYRATPFLQGAAARGCPTADGRGMLLHQGALSLQIWTGKPAPTESMRQALEAALAQRRH